MTTPNMLHRAALFQFHKGTIRTVVLPASCVCGFNFNSIKVRLELTTPNMLHRAALFQFHKGTIRTSDNEQYICLCGISIP